MIARRRAKKHSDLVRYVVSVLFLHGLSERLIVRKIARGRIATLSKGQVSGILNGTPFRGLDLVARQGWLDRLKEQRLDEGRLDEWVFTATSTDARGGAR